MARETTKKRPTTEAHGEKRNEILRHCAVLFDRVGYHKASMQMLADEVGLGKPTLYHYFPSKHDILYAIHDAHMSTLMEGLDGGKTDANPLELLRGACIDILRQIAEHPGYVRAFMDHYGDLEGKLRSQIRERRNEYFARLQSIIEEGIADGQFRECDPTLTTYGFLGMCNWAYKWYPPLAKKRSPEDVADALCRPFFEGLSRSAD
ncbi:TetR/AcrR family transcriptional regulator [Novosphingobium resinovorum]|uniref:TetR/AcrR family transcriptional regulator n=1 Tax=Novosphingobium resinovorum TaxID=158500 RepID=UPI002ED0A338|nr:TetR/AcrR family transcriptional regulator [Novosphingobium resinovorum]